MGHVAPSSLQAFLRGISQPRDDRAADTFTSSLLAATGSSLFESDAEGITGDQILGSEFRGRFHGYLESFIGHVHERLREVSLASTRQRLADVMRYIHGCFGRLETLTADALTNETAASRLHDPTASIEAEGILSQMRATYPISAASSDERALEVMERHDPNPNPNPHCALSR